MSLLFKNDWKIKRDFENALNATISDKETKKKLFKLFETSISISFFFGMELSNEEAIKQLKAMIKGHEKENSIIRNKLTRSKADLTVIRKNFKQIIS